MSENTTPEKLGRYEIVRELGKGAMGVVYEGRDPNIGRRVAIKTARRDVLERSPQASEMLERFLREAKAAGALSHPNIITIYDAAEQEGIAYIAMEFLEGGDLSDLIEQRRSLEPEEIAELGATICEALAVAHDQGVVHRDIKPANILMPTNAPLKVADFGIAHVQDSTLTQDGALIGTPYYMSPEQFMGQKVDGRSDLFSAGIILYELLTGEKPFTGEAVSTIMQHVIRTMPVPPQDLNFNCPTPLGQVIMKALAKRPAERYQDGRAMATALRESVKPNPDVEKLGLTGPGFDPAAATVATDGAGAATVVAAAGMSHAAAQEDLGATTAGNAPGQHSAAAQTTVGTPPPGATATGGATVASTSASGATTYNPPTISSRLPAIAIGGGLLAVGVVIALIFAALGGESGPWFKSVTLQVYETDSFEAMQAWGGVSANKEVREAALDEAGRNDWAITPTWAQIQIRALPSEEILVDKQVIDEAGDKISFQGRPQHIQIRFAPVAKGETLNADTFNKIAEEWAGEAVEPGQEMGLGELNLLFERRPNP